MEWDKPKQEYHYRPAIGMLDYLTKTMRDDLTMDVYRCTRFCQDHKIIQEMVVG